MKKLISLANAFLFSFLFSLSVKAVNPSIKPGRLKEGEYIPNTILLKMKPSLRSQCSLNSIGEPRIKNVLEQLNVTSVAKVFPRANIPATGLNRYGKKLVDLSLVYKIKYTGKIDIEKAIRLFQFTGAVEYAEPKYVEHMCFSPNDPSATSQYFLTNINAFAAWDVWQGDTNTVIGITDSGTDWDHPDLVGNIKYNYADPINGVDDDLDGFTDNYRGWDISESDNDPMVVGSTHGSHVSGCAAASTNNSTGVASPSFKCKFLPVKCSFDASTSSIDDGFEAIVYAADHGCSVINCSWGRSGGYSQFEQDVVNYATFNHDAAVVAAAGNDGVEEDFLPASYENVVSVASTRQSDTKSGFSNYGFKVDVSAPGSSIFSTVFNNSYVNMSGTSMASPVAAGSLALIRSWFPSLNASQAAEQLRVTCDNVYSLSGNANYRNKLGGGRINLFNALVDSMSPGIEVNNLNVDDRNDNLFVLNDSLWISALFTNLLKPTSNLTVTLTTSSPYVDLLDSVFNIGILNTMDSISNSGLPFRLVIKPNAPVNSQIQLTMLLSDGTYQDFYSFNVVVNVDYINIAINDVSTSITSFGRIGYNSDGPGQGLGFTYSGSESLLYEAGLMIGTDATHVTDNIRSTAGATDNDYRSLLTVHHVIPGVSDFDAYGKFDDGIAPAAGRLNVLIQHRAYAWTSTPDRNYVIVQYTIQNIGSGTLNNLYAGIFTDWDVLPIYNHNRSSTDLSRRMGYTYCTDVNGFYAGVKLLSFDGFNHYALDNDATGSGGINMSDSYTDAEKYTSLSTGRANSGVNGQGNEVCDVTSTGPITLGAGDSITVAFAILAAHDEATLNAGADAAQTQYNNVIGVNEISMTPGFGMIENFPNPANKEMTIRFMLPENNNTELTIFNALGEKVKTILNRKMNAGQYSVVVDLSGVENGTYFCRLNSGTYSKGFPLVVAH